MKKYILSQDVGLLIGDWARRNGFNIPGPKYFEGMTNEIAADIQYLFDSNNKKVAVEVLLAKKIIHAVNKKIKNDRKDFVISLEKAYFACDAHLEVSRTVKFYNSHWQELGEMARPGCLSFEEQIRIIARKAKNKKVVLLDDGCWTGHSIEKISGALSSANVNIEKIVFGIMIDRGPIKAAAPIESIFVFPEKDVLDWVCERDFVPGTPLGGKTVSDENDDDNFNVGAYYLFGMGDFKNWASLDFDDETIKMFTRRRLRQAAKLFEKIGDLSKRPVLLNDMERIPLGYSAQKERRFVEILESGAERL